MQPKVSIVVPVYNTEKYIKKCVSSICQQTLKDIEILLIDDGSCDESGKICDELASHDSRIRVIHQKNVGLGMTRNRGIEATTGEYIGFVDSDDEIEHDFYESLYALSKGGDVDAVTGGVTDIYPTKSKPHPHLLSGETLEHDEIIKKLLPTMLGYDEQCSGYAGMSVCRGIFARKILIDNQIRFKSEREIISEDAVFDIEFFTKCKKVAVSNSVGYHYFHRENYKSLSTRYSSERFEKNKYLYKYEIGLIRALGIKNKDVSQRIKSMFIANTRVLIMQEANSDNTLQEKQAHIKRYLNDSLLQKVLRVYNYRLYPKKLKIFTLCMSLRWSWPVLIMAFVQTHFGKHRD